MKPRVIVWDLETGPDLGGFAAANDLVGKSDVEVEASNRVGADSASVTYRLEKKLSTSLPNAM